ncbi:MAG: alpha/beta hydrolase [Candidatus Acidiferrales bacterium]
MVNRSPYGTICGEKSFGDPLDEQMKLVATDVTVIVLPNGGHLLMEEQPKKMMDALRKLL